MTVTSDVLSLENMISVIIFYSTHAQQTVQLSMENHVNPDGKKLDNGQSLKQWASHHYFVDFPFPKTLYTCLLKRNEKNNAKKLPGNVTEISYMKNWLPNTYFFGDDSYPKPKLIALESEL